MDKEELRRRKRRKQQQIRRRKMMRAAACVLAVILVIVFVVKGIIMPLTSSSSNTSEEEAQQTEVQEEETETLENAASRIPLKNQNNLTKASQLTVGWHEDAEGKWYQNADGTFFAGGMQEIDGVIYYFNDNGFMQTGWVSIGFNDYYFNEDGSYDETVKKPMIALTFDDGPGQYTDDLLNCLEENGAHATFFMVGSNIEGRESTVQHMVDAGCELGNHTWDHPEATLSNLDVDTVLEEFQKTDDALQAAVGQTSTVCRAPYGEITSDELAAVGKPFFMWSIDSLDWSYRDVTKDYDAVMNSEYLEDGTIVLMHDIHEESVEAAKKLIPDLIAQGYKLVTVSEMAAAKDVTLQAASYSDFMKYSLENGLVAGYAGNTTESTDESEDSSDEDSSDEDSSEEDSEDSSEDSEESYDDGSEDYSSDESSEEDYSDEDYSEEDYSE